MFKIIDLALFQTVMTTILSCLKESPSPNSAYTEPYLITAVPRYMHRYPQFIDIIQPVRTIVSDWKPGDERGKYELEARFGKWMGQYFQSGVSKQFVEQILSMFDTFGQWESVSPWEETHDYYYKVLSSPDSTVRTTASFVSDPLSGRKYIKTEHIRKHVQHKFDCQYVNMGCNAFQYDLRMSLSYEENVRDDELPSIVNPSYVRIKSRKSYFYKSENIPQKQPLWRFDITRSWSGNTKTQAELSQKMGNTTYEVELECLDPHALMVSPQHDAFYVSCSMLLKMKDFLSYDGSENFKWQPIECSPALSLQFTECF